MQESGGGHSELLIVLLDFCYIDQASFEADLSALDPDITDDELAAECSKFLGEVERVQLEQVAVLQALGIDRIFIERLAPQYVLVFQHKVAMIQDDPKSDESGDLLLQYGAP